ncbi:MAG: SurA N-terminal domain-containing protein [Pseudomonadota bacterium]
MLNALRRGAKGTLAKLLIGLLVLSFAVWGISDFVNQIDPTEVARAGDTPVSANEFSRVYQRTMNRTFQQVGRALSPQEAQALGVPNQVLAQLLSEAFQVDAARALGVDLGDDALAERIRQDPVFFGSDGGFDRLRFDDIIASNRYTEAEFIELQRDTASQEMLMNALVGGLKAPTPYLRAVNRFTNQTRNITYFIIGEDQLAPIADPTEAALRSYYDEHKADFRAPEYRGVSLVTLSADALADPAAVSADDVRRAYEVEGAFGSPEERGVQQVIYSNRTDAEKAATAINNGTEFETVLADLERSFADVDLGVVERDDLVDPAVAEAAFELELNTAAAVDGRFGPVVVRVSEIKQAGKRPLSEVEDEIRQQLALEEAQDQVRDTFDSVEDAVAGGARVAEIGERFSLPTRTFEAIDREGNLRTGTPPEPAVPSQILASAFAGAAGDDAIPIEIGEDFTWVQVDDVTPAADRPYDEVAGDVIVAWTAAEKENQLKTFAEEAVGEIVDGASVTDVAQKLGATAVVSDAFSRSSEPDTDVPQVAAVASFEGPLGHAGSVVDDDGRHIVFAVTEVSEPAFFEADADLQNARLTLDQDLAETLILEFVNNRQVEVGATVNQPVLDVLIGVADPQHGGMGGMYR